MDDLKLYGNNEKEAGRLKNNVKIFSKDIAMEHSISKSSHITLTARKLVDVGGMELSSREVIPELGSDKGYIWQIHWEYEFFKNCLVFLPTRRMVFTKFQK